MDDDRSRSRGRSRRCTPPFAAPATPATSADPTERLLRTLITGLKPDSDAVKFKVPDTFDGTDPTKLRAFIMQSSLYMTAKAKQFDSDNKRVLFALS